jgi:hypothetical protein
MPTDKMKQRPTRSRPGASFYMRSLLSIACSVLLFISNGACVFGCTDALGAQHRTQQKRLPATASSLINSFASATASSPQTLSYNTTANPKDLNFTPPCHKRNQSKKPAEKKQNNSDHAPQDQPCSSYELLTDWRSDKQTAKNLCEFSFVLIVAILTPTPPQPTNRPPAAIFPALTGALHPNSQRNLVLRI